MPKDKQDHPIVWISWFAAAKYCNWLSRKENLPLYYRFNIEDREHPFVDVCKKSTGYRLPTEKEWIFAASEGNLSAESIKDGKSEKEIERIEKKYFQDSISSTIYVKSENPNKYGVYGLMGNVREWVDNPKLEKITQYGEQLIKGMGWLLGEEGFEFKTTYTLIAQNNNVDVGFRIARNLTNSENQKVKSAYRNFQV